MQRLESVVALRETLHCERFRRRAHREALLESLDRRDGDCRRGAKHQEESGSIGQHETRSRSLITIARSGANNARLENPNELVRIAFPIDSPVAFLHGCSTVMPCGVGA